MPKEVDSAEYLDRHGVTAYMKDVVTLLLENRPPNPIAFIAKYFQTVTQGSSPLLRAYRYIQLTPPTHGAFVDNLVAAYATLDGRRGASHVTGADLVRLLRLLCVDCPVDVSGPLLILLDRTESEPISIDDFSAAVRAGLWYDRFFARVRALFSACDPHNTGTVPRSVLQLSLRQLRTDCADASFIAALKLEHARDTGGADAAGAAAAGAGPSSSSPNPPALGSSAARSELHRLQREAQWEVSQLQIDAARSPAQPRTPSSSLGSSPEKMRSGTGAGGDGTGAMVTLEEFSRALFSGSLGPEVMEIAAAKQPGPATSSATATAIKALHQEPAGSPAAAASMSSMVAARWGHAP